MSMHDTPARGDYVQAGDKIGSLNQAPLPRALDALDNELEVLESLTGKLRSLLDPVLTPSQPTALDPSGMSSPDEPASEATNRVRQSTTTVERISRRISDLLQRVEV